MNDFMAREFWRFVVVQQEVAKLATTAIDYPPMQSPATFNLDAVKAKVEEMMKAHEGQWPGRCSRFRRAQTSRLRLVLKLSRSTCSERPIGYVGRY